MKGQDTLVTNVKEGLLKIKKIIKHMRYKHKGAKNQHIYNCDQCD